MRLKCGLGLTAIACGDFAYLFIYLFIYDVLNSAVTSYGCMASIGRMASEYRVRTVWRGVEVT